LFVVTFLVKNNQALNRFEARVNGIQAFLDYKLQGSLMTLVHTEVPSELGGQGVGGSIVKAALHFAREQGLRVVPECPFVIHYIDRHGKYRDLVAE
jgi:predicted GNAT family acetyltransferase